MLNASLSMETDTIFLITVSGDAGYVQYKYRSWHKLLCVFFCAACLFSVCHCKLFLKLG
jgi:hypothetical protein